MSAFEKRSIGQLIRFLAVGVSNTLVDLLVTRFLQWGAGAVFASLLLTYYLPKVIGYALGIVNSYVLNSGWTFRAERRRDAREMGSFLAVNLVTLGLSLLLMHVFLNVMGLGAWWDGIAGGGWIGTVITGSYFCTILSTGICLLVNFAGNKLFVFGRREKESDGARKPPGLISSRSPYAPIMTRSTLSLTSGVMQSGSGRHWPP